MKPNHYLSSINNKLVSIESWLRALESEMKKCESITLNTGLDMPVSDSYLNLVINQVRNEKESIKKLLSDYCNNIK